MKKLVIHPKDRSTAFLSTVYEDLDNVTLVTGGVNREELKDMVQSHDQVMMMGHGTPHGLMSVGQFNGYGNIVDDSFAPLLAEKDNSIFIWCNADGFVRYHKLKGFYTGMFISEVGEARMMGLPLTEQSDVDESNETFVDIMRDASNEDIPTMHSAVTQRYGHLVRHNEVARYNHERMYAA